MLLLPGHILRRSSLMITMLFSKWNIVVIALSYGALIARWVENHECRGLSLVNPVGVEFGELDELQLTLVAPVVIVEASEDRA